jgi:hypothetical protein
MYKFLRFLLQTLYRQMSLGDDNMKNVRNKQNQEKIKGKLKLNGKNIQMGEIIAKQLYDEYLLA